MHCYQLSGEENAQVRADRKRSGADKEVWGGCPRQRLEGKSSRLAGSGTGNLRVSRYCGADLQPVQQEQVGNGVMC